MALTRSPFPPIADHAFLSDCHTGALLAPDGSVDWLCVPRCSFWLVSALCIVGEMDKATALLEKLLRIASPLGLYAEEFDADTGRHLGNFPQAFSPLALVEAAGRIILADRLEEIGA